MCTEGTVLVEAECKTCSDAYGWFKLPTRGRTYVTVMLSLSVVGTASTRSVYGVLSKRVRVAPTIRLSTSPGNLVVHYSGDRLFCAIDASWCTDYANTPSSTVGIHMLALPVSVMYTCNVTTVGTRSRMSAVSTTYATRTSVLCRSHIAAHTAPGALGAVPTHPPRALFVVGFVAAASSVLGGVRHTSGVTAHVSCKFDLRLCAPGPYETPYRGIAVGHVRYTTVTHTATAYSRLRLLLSRLVLLVSFI